MKKIFPFFLMLLLITSCSKQYKYELLKSNQVVESSFFDAQDDSTAYKIAHGKYLIYTQAIFKKTGDINLEIYDFRLTNPQGKDISTGDFLFDAGKVREISLWKHTTTEYRKFISYKYDAERVKKEYYNNLFNRK